MQEHLHNTCKMEWIKNKDFPQEMAENAQNLDSALSEMETVVNQLISMPLNEAHSCMKPLERSKYDTASVYAVTSLFWAYMKTQGVDPKTNGLPKELERVKNVIGRAKQIADKALAPKLDVSAAKRFIRGGLWESKDGEKKDDGNMGNQVQDGDVPKPPLNKRIRFDDDLSSTQLTNEER
ncbi:nuclear nucleic acid-binding protein C1D-like [Daphnia carinata]|uniref:nuclear nucleic acid-binding protein C1D-like n=1 Tax=Daphnia carinata TaxID=120202 RepID=UPI00257C6F88|nr:nuclear nucleic acid-binding protein C1D-like [Daphnia carinata]